MAKYGVCQQVKAEHQWPARQLQSLLVLKWKWEFITIDFVFGLPRSKKGNDVVWVIIDRLTKSALFLTMKKSDYVDKLAKMYVNEMVRLHRVPVPIVSNKNPRFTSRLWLSIQLAMGTKLNLSTAFHP